MYELKLQATFRKQGRKLGVGGGSPFYHYNIGTTMIEKWKNKKRKNKCM
jgi:hypothetical protein